MLSFVMAIPDYQSIMLPLLKFLSDGKEHSKWDASEHIIKTFKLTDDEKNEKLLSGQQTVIDNRVGWARTYLKKAGLLESTARGYFKITPRGIDVLKQNPDKINLKFLEKFPEFIEFRRVSKSEKTVEDADKYNKETPQESLEYGYQKMRRDLIQDILKTVKTASPKFFERLVIDLLLKMGYGGPTKDGKAIGQSGDGGIDGVINEDKLGLDVIYVQAKRWDSAVGRPEVQKFAGALQGKRARKGIFITTSSFTKDATDFSNIVESKIVLIDGEQLAQYMIDHDIGVSKIVSYDIKKIDSDYFSEE
jgi:restriction system protein